MAIRIDASGDYLQRTTGLINHNGTYTVAMWMRWINRSDYTHLYAANIANDLDWQNSDAISISGDGRTRLFAANAGANSENLGTFLSENTWYHVAMVRTTATDLKLYLNGVQDGSVTLDITGRSATGSQIVGTLNGTGYWFNGRVYALKEWTTNLSVAEIVNEMQTVRPMRLDSLNAWYPFLPGSAERVKNYAGTADWTETGTITDEDPAPISWGRHDQVFIPAAAAGETITVDKWHQAIQQPRIERLQVVGY